MTDRNQDPKHDESWLDRADEDAAFSSGTSDFDFDSDGKRIGNIRFVTSGTPTGWQTVLVPVGVVRNGDGPTLTVIGGTHGDEVEGPVAALKLLNRLQPESIKGRVIVLPALNIQAVESAQRTAPSDELDLNRSFPGDPAGLIAPAIAHFVDRRILRISDVVLDIHSGGRFLRFPGSLWLLKCPDDGLMTRIMEAARAFGAPYTIVSPSLGGDMSESAARHGCAYISTELSGAGTVDRHLLALTERGIVRLLAHLGIGEAEDSEPPPPTRIMVVAGGDAIILAPRHGLFEPYLDIEDRVEAGQPLGCLHVIETPGEPGVPIVSPMNGMIYGLRWPAHVRRAERIAIVAIPDASCVPHQV